MMRTISHCNNLAMEVVISPTLDTCRIQLERGAGPCGLRVICVVRKLSLLPSQLMERTPSRKLSSCDEFFRLSELKQKIVYRELEAGSHPLTRRFSLPSDPVQVHLTPSSGYAELRCPNGGALDRCL